MLVSTNTQDNSNHNVPVSTNAQNNSNHSILVSTNTQYNSMYRLAMLQPTASKARQP